MTVYNNTGDGLEQFQGELELNNTIIAGNTTVDCSFFGSGTRLPSHHNLDSDNTCLFTDLTDLPNTNPLVGALQNNGGWTLTHALLAGSAAIDAGDNTSCPTSDQRRVSRPLDGDTDGTAACDIGAYEAHGSPGAVKVIKLYDERRALERGA